MAIETTPLGFLKPDGNELVKQGDNVIATNAQKSQDLHAKARADIVNLQSAAGFDGDPVEMQDTVVAALVGDGGTATGAAFSAAIGTKVPPLIADAIAADETVVAAAAAAVDANPKIASLEASRWWRGELATGSSLSTLFTLGLHSARSGSVAASITGKPSDTAFNNPFKVLVELISSTNGIYKQTIEAKITGMTRTISYNRTSLSGTYLGWEASDAKTQEEISAIKGVALDSSMIALFGDSQTEASAGTSWPEYTSPLLTGSTLVNYARSGDDTNAILIRAGAKVVSFQVSGGSVPASGTVNLTSSERLELRTNRAIVGGSLVGVSGTLTHVAGDAYTFTRTTAGSAVSAPGWQPFTTGITTSAATALFWMGGNDFNQGVDGNSRTIADHVLGAYRQAIEWGRKTRRRVLIAGVTNRLTALYGSEGFAQVQRINRTLRTLYPDAFLDVQAYYVERAIYDMGLTPTAAELLVMGRGEIPARLFIDDVHLSGPAHQALAANWLAPWLAASGYATTTVAQPPLPALAPADNRAADTGWWDVSATLINGWTGEVHIRRDGNTVWYRVRNLNPATATSHAFYQQVPGLRIWQTYAADPDLDAYTDTVYRIARNMALPAINHYWRQWSFISDEPMPVGMPGIKL